MTEPEPRPSRRLTPATVIGLVAVAVLVLLFAAVAVGLLLNM